MRVVAQELSTNAIVLESAAESESSPPTREFISTAAWEGQREVLAECLSDELWNELANVHDIILRGIALLDIAIEHDQSLKERQTASGIKEVVNDARSAAAKLSKAKPLVD
jgi:hypothetical protein